MRMFKHRLNKFLQFFSSDTPSSKEEPALETNIEILYSNKEPTQIDARIFGQLSNINRFGISTLVSYEGRCYSIETSKLRESNIPLVIGTYVSWTGTSVSAPDHLIQAENPQPWSGSTPVIEWLGKTIHGTITGNDPQKKVAFKVDGKDIFLSLHRAQLNYELTFKSSKLLFIIGYRSHSKKINHNHYTAIPRLSDSDITPPIKRRSGIICNIHSGRAFVFDLHSRRVISFFKSQLERVHIPLFLGAEISWLEQRKGVAERNIESIALRLENILSHSTPLLGSFHKGTIKLGPLGFTYDLHLGINLKKIHVDIDKFNIKDIEDIEDITHIKNFTFCLGIEPAIGQDIKSGILIACNVHYMNPMHKVTPSFGHKSFDERRSEVKQEILKIFKKNNGIIRIEQATPALRNFGISTKAASPLTQLVIACGDIFSITKDKNNIVTLRRL
ncbi:hypothetical protein KSF73_02305 [Burkholderiaceae bacterium DAT-1]|nr:hypothetical protein [Burkholderiaceae bacterium DAT-1]